MSKRDEIVSLIMDWAPEPPADQMQDCNALADRILAVVAEPSEAMVEAVARALAQRFGYDPDEIVIAADPTEEIPAWTVYEGTARAATAALRALAAMEEPSSPAA